MKRLLIVSTTLGMLAAFGFSGPGMAAKAPSPGLTGVWLLDQNIFDNATERRNPPLTPEAKVAADAQRKARAGSNQVIGESERTCTPPGMPGMMTNEFATAIMETPGRITMINEDNPLPRTISLTRKAHSTEQNPGYNGNSIGHWEGKTLVVETTNLNDRSTHIPGVAMKGGVVKITERFHLEKGGELLVNDITFENPMVLTRPWTVRYGYHRGEKDAQLWEYVCQVNAPGWSERFQNDPEFKGGQAKN